MARLPRKRRRCCATGLVWIEAEGGKRFFLKKEAKTLANWLARQSGQNALRARVFWFFFAKKNSFCSVLAAYFSR
jgi:hypothetical protein